MRKIYIAILLLIISIGCRYSEDSKLYETKQWDKKDINEILKQKGGMEYYDRYLISQIPEEQILYLQKLIRFIKRFEKRKYCMAGSLVNMYARLCLVYKKQGDSYNADIAFYKAAYWYLKVLESKYHTPKLTPHEIILKYKEFFKSKKVLKRIQKLDEINRKELLSH